MKAFLTGSQIYGTPSKHSDIDMVVHTCPIMIDLLTQKCDLSIGKEYGSSNASLRFGNLNLICLTDLYEFIQWRQARDELCEHAPVTHDEAVLHHRQLLKDTL